MKKMTIFGAGILVLAILLRVGVIFVHQASSQGAQANLMTAVATVNGKSLTLEIASSPAEQQEGLGDRDSMSLDHGMLFLFPQPGRYSFWMRHMRFPLDIIWIRDGKVVDIAYNLPPPKSALEIPAAYTPKVEADQVLELNAGGAQAYGLQIGGRLTLF